jgi:predicted nucleic acid-binding protein
MKNGPPSKLAQRRYDLCLAAKQRRVLTVIGPCLDALLQQDFRIAPGLYRNVLHAAGEDSGID